jgi:hypothetical protein
LSIVVFVFKIVIVFQVAVLATQTRMAFLKLCGHRILLHKKLNLNLLHKQSPGGSEQIAQSIPVLQQTVQILGI